jgi:hypothetical protein
MSVTYVPGPLVPFGIGTYQSVSGGTTIGAGFPTTAFSLTHPYAGTYGGTMGYLLDLTIRTPAQVQYTPALEVGLDGYGASVVRSYPSMVWSYSTLRPDYWYYLMQLYRQSVYTPPGFQYLVLLQYADPAGSGTAIQQLARMDPPVVGQRTSSVYQNIQLKFTYIGQAQLDAGTPILLHT